MASKKRLALTIEQKCPKCGKKVSFNLINLRQINSAEKNGEAVPAKIYRCDFCGHKITKK